MFDLEHVFLALTLVGLAGGGWGILLARTGRAPAQISWGRILFVATIIFLGGSSLVAAFHHADGLVPLGLSAGFLVIGMLWEAPGQSRAGQDALLPEDEK